MFGHDDNQQPTQDNDAVQAAMPEPLADGSLDVSAQQFGAPSGAPSMSGSNLASASNPMSVDSPSDSPSVAASSMPTDGGDLLNLKQQALQHLSPLVSHLDQTPEEKFRTTMMMIQASDDQTLIKTAFEAAQKITDDKARAQALLDVINEINYFTQHQNNN